MRTVTVDTSTVEAYAHLIGDLNPVHLDESAAAASMFGRRIAHGMLLSSYFSAILASTLPGPGTIYLRQSVVFRKPVYVGDTVEFCVEVQEVDTTRRRAVLATTCSRSDGVLAIDGEAYVWLPPEDAATT